MVSFNRSAMSLNQVGGLHGFSGAHAGGGLIQQEDPGFRGQGHTDLKVRFSPWDRWMQPVPSNPEASHIPGPGGFSH